MQSKYSDPYSGYRSEVIPTCLRLVRNPSIGKTVRLQNYGNLHKEGKKLIRVWFKRAFHSRDCEPRDSFEPFIYLWIAFNAWASCVSEIDRDYEWLQAISVNARICSKFDEQVADNDTRVAAAARDFYALWPIFKAQDIRRRGAQLYGGESRDEIVSHYFSSGIQRYQPACWLEHEERGEPVPLDWPHTLSVLYCVRCNLFHGEKAAHSEMDQIIVYNAYQVLLYFLSSGGYIA